MGYWNIVVPEACVNLCENPSFEANVVTGWSAGIGHSIAASLTRSFKGAHSGLITIGGAGYNLAIHNVSGLTVSGTYIISCWIYVPTGWDGGNIYFDALSLTGVSVTYTRQWTSGTSPYDQWYYIESKVELASDVSGTFQILRSGTANTGKTVYFDAVQFEENTHSTTFCDGDQPDCLWTGERHLSTSERPSWTRQGGRIYNLDSLGIYVINSPGIGVAPIKTLSQDQSLLPGTLHVGEKIAARDWELILIAQGSNRENLHSLRKTLINYVSPESVKGSQPFWLQYSGAHSTKVIQIQCVYCGGLEWSLPDGYSEKFAMMLRSDDPRWYEVADQTTSLSEGISLTSTNRILKKVDGSWGKLGTGIDDEIYCMAISPKDGLLYVGGAFHTANGVTVNHIAKWNGTTFEALGASVGLNGVVNAIAFDAAGILYAGGSFTDVNGGPGGTYPYIIKWNGSTWGVVDAGAGLTDTVQALLFGLDGYLYAGGLFHTADGTTVNHIAYWNGTSWNAMGGATKGVDDNVYCLANYAGSIVVGGDFLNAGGSPANQVARWNGSSWNAMGAGMTNGTVMCLLGPRTGGILYAGGSFTTPSNTGEYMSQWNGVYWNRLPKQVNGTVRHLAMDPDGNVWAGGAFDMAGDLETADYMAIWNGSNWFLADVDLPGTPGILKFVWNDAGDMFLGFNSTGTAIGSAKVNSTNLGSSRWYPRIVIKRSGGTYAKIKWIKNETTGFGLNFNEYSLQDGETLEINLQPGNRYVKSSIPGISGGQLETMRWDALLSSSDFAEFSILPGNNEITTYIATSGTPTLEVYMTGPIPHISADGVAS